MTMPSVQRNVAHSIETKKRTNDIEITEKLDFSSLFLSDVLLDGLKSSGFVRPSPIQLKAIPLGRCGLDLIVQAKSGTGKTCVFTVIALDGLDLTSQAPQVLVLAPTREIALQIYEVFLALGSSMAALQCQTFIGGMPLHEDKQKIKNCHVVIGTPGRVKQLIEQGVLSTASIRLFVLDEADKLLEESFQKQVNWIYSSLPENKQIVALSATYPDYLAQHLTTYMRDPTFVRLNSHDPALLGIKQYYLKVGHHPLPNRVFDMKSAALIKLISSVQFQQCLVFSNYQTRAEDLSNLLNARGFPSVHIAGSHDQRARNQAMHKLKSFQCRLLISTDLTSRGIDCDKVNLVVNLDLPPDHETYLHRIGRAGRFGSFGAAVSMVSEGKEYTDMRKVEKRCNTKISPLPDPVPVNLTEASEPVYLDDIVSSERIITKTAPKCPNDVIIGDHDNGIVNGNGCLGDETSSHSECTDDAFVDCDGDSKESNSNKIESEELNTNNSALEKSEMENGLVPDPIVGGAAEQSAVCHSFDGPNGFSTPNGCGENRTANGDFLLDGSFYRNSDCSGFVADEDESSVSNEQEEEDSRRSIASDVTDYGVWLDEDIPLKIPNYISNNDAESTDFATKVAELRDFLSNDVEEDLVYEVSPDDVVDVCVPSCSNQLLKSVSNYVHHLAMDRMSSEDTYDIFNDTPANDDVTSFVTSFSDEKVSVEKESTKVVIEEGLRIRKPRNFEQRSTASFLANIRADALKSKSEATKVKSNADVNYAGKSDDAKFTLVDLNTGVDESVIECTKIAHSMDNDVAKSTSTSSNINDVTDIVYEQDLCYRRDYLHSKRNSDSSENSDTSESESDESDDDVEDNHDEIPHGANPGVSHSNYDDDYCDNDYGNHHAQYNWNYYDYNYSTNENFDYNDENGHYNESQANEHYCPDHECNNDYDWSKCERNLTEWTNREEFYQSYSYWYYTYYESMNYWRSYRRWYNEYMNRKRNEAMRLSMMRAHERMRAYMNSGKNLTP